MKRDEFVLRFEDFIGDLFNRYMALNEKQKREFLKCFPRLKSNPELAPFKEVLEDLERIFKEHAGGENEK